MKRVFKIPKKSNSFFIHISEPLVCNDVNSYCIKLEYKEEMKGAQIVVCAKREDGQVITDSVTVNSSDISYTLKNNMYSVPGEVNIRIRIIKDAMALTEKQLIFSVIEGYENGDAADDRIPTLEKLLIEAQNIIDNSIKIADWNCIDTITSRGIYKLVNIPEIVNYDINSETSYSVYDTDGDLLYVYDYTYYYNGERNEQGCCQTRYCADGKILSRIDATGTGAWSEWSENNTYNLHIVNNLESTSTTEALSANMGHLLNESKVDKVAGKGLSEADFTNAEKQKLADLPSEITDNIPVVESTEIDNIADGVCLVHYPAYATGKEGDYRQVHAESWEILIQRSIHGVSVDGTTDEVKLQMRLDASGNIYCRSYDSLELQWEAWAERDTLTVINELTSNSKTAALSANMGKVLHGEIDTLIENIAFIVEELQGKIDKKVDITVFDEKMGDIETALDGIIAMQNSYTGGDEA